MKYLITLIIGVVSAVAVHAGHMPPPSGTTTDTLIIDEINDTLVITLNGTPISGSAFAPTGPKDHWVLTLTGYSFDKNVNGTFKLGEPENTNEKNEISSFNKNGHFEWRSDIANSKNDTGLPFSITVLDAGTDPKGNPFNLTLEENGGSGTCINGCGESAPDNGATVMLFGGALTGLGVMRRYLKR